jgi:Kef-type K+ transport system membrane component KefB/voltage-gated potassium channel Kch
MHSDVFTQLSVVIVIALVVSVVMRLLRQPLIMGYILTGVIVGPSLLGLIGEKEAFATFSEIGIALLLFLIGLELSVATVRRMGKPAFLTAMALLMTIGTIGFLVGSALHFNTLESVLIGLALFFSSTIIIAKVLSDKRELTRLNGQIAIGVILLDDIVATFALLFIASQAGDNLGPADVGMLVAKGVLVLLGLVVMGTKVLPWVTRHMAKSQELLFIFALAWGFGVASLINSIGFSVEIGALFAGVALAHLPYVHQIGARLKPLRDFFIILFFISLGDSLNLDSLSAAIVPALIMSAVVVILKPIAVMTSLGVLGYTKRTSFKTGINLSQISEFSIIMIVLAIGAGIMRPEMGAIITLVAIITITVSTYLMQYDNAIYALIEKHLRLFERKSVRETAQQNAKVYPLVLFGYRNGGQQFVKTFRSMKLPFVVIDYDPEVIDELYHKRIDYLYGDATDFDILSEINIEKASLIVNTIGDHEVNLTLVKYVRHHNEDAVIICYSHNHNQAAELYEHGASYVFLPHFIGSEQLSMFIHKYGLDKRNFEDFRKQHLDEISRYLAIRDQ